jgi:hypothetical protein
VCIRAGNAVVVGKMKPKIKHAVDFSAPTDFLFFLVKLINGLGRAQAG